MSETTQLWLFGVIGGWLLILSGSVGTLIIGQMRLKYALELFIDGVGKRAARLLHSPDNHLGIDAFLDAYIDRNYELSSAQWEELKGKLDLIFSDTNATANERSLAALLAEVCKHNLTFNPPKASQRIDLK